MAPRASLGSGASQAPRAAPSALRPPSPPSLDFKKMGTLTSLSFLPYILRVHRHGVGRPRGGMKNGASSRWKGGLPPAWQRIRYSALDKAPVCAEGTAECAVRRRCRCRPDTHNEEVTLENEDRGTEHNAGGLVEDVEGQPRPGMAKNTLQCIG
ncbi:hypothetical protein NDU88_002729 [Pleurodeles waltl]|uniref:Uncharacterized protein n=1 Tax=Pleurodeles waltl TaxID=8319 RepID=A0AAV7T4G0_PLEWA|nr:hypothetical protein NDU88_002729 [Pleurodeles waltl]